MLPFSRNVVHALTNINGSQGCQGRKPGEPREVLRNYNPMSCVKPEVLNPTRTNSRPHLKLQSPFERQMEFEEQLIRNPLTRGIGIKPIKMVKALLGTPTIFGHLSASPRPVSYRFPHPPEKGLGNALKERNPGQWIGRADLPKSSQGVAPISITTVPRVDLSSLVSILCLGSFMYWGILPEYVFQFPLSELNGLTLPSTREGVSEANQTRFKAGRRVGCHRQALKVDR